MDVSTTLIVTVENLVTWILVSLLSRNVSRAIEHWNNALKLMEQANHDIEEAINELNQGNKELQEVKDQLRIIANNLDRLVR